MIGRKEKSSAPCDFNRIRPLELQPVSFPLESPWKYVVETWLVNGDW